MKKLFKKIGAFSVCVSMAVCSFGSTYALAAPEEADAAAQSSAVMLPSDSNVGDVVLFGTYEQDNDTSNGAEAIEWIVLDRNEDQALIISKYALDCKPYHNVTEPVTWETCSLRTWLNDTFFHTAFSEQEQASILPTTLTNPDHPSFGTEGGNDTVDQVFLLSTEEANRYFSTNEDRIVYPTAYAYAQGCYTCNQTTFLSHMSQYGDEYDSEASCWWWLRSPGFHTVYANSVHDNGQVIARSPGSDVRRGDNAVRPAMWVRVSDTIVFGSYEQDNDTSNGTEGIEWIVLTVEDGKALLVSKYALDCKPYSTKGGHVTWETSTLRAWLNSEFLQTAFSADEQSRIVASTVVNPDNSSYGTQGGNDTNDMVFLLSLEEVLQYFPTMQDRITYPTAYAYAQGCYTFDVNTKQSYWNAWGDPYCSTASCWWWQRSIGFNPIFATSCHDDGQLTPSSLGSDMRRSDTAVRPALWIDLQ